MVARRVGVQVAAVIRDIQEKYNQFVVFYQTGKLAYYSSKIWEQYDTQFAITQRTEEMKRRAMKRAAGWDIFFVVFLRYQPSFTSFIVHINYHHQTSTLRSRISSGVTRSVISGR